MTKQNTILYAGDAVAIAVLTIIGFASHRELIVSSIPRMGATFLPAAVAWFVIAPWFELFDAKSKSTSRMSIYWRITLAALYASTMAAFLRGLILGSDIPPSFIAGLGGSTALGLVVWRWTYSRLTQ